MIKEQTAPLKVYHINEVVIQNRIQSFVFVGYFQERREQYLVLKWVSDLWLSATRPPACAGGGSYSHSDVYLYLFFLFLKLCG